MSKFPEKTFFLDFKTVFESKLAFVKKAVLHKPV